MPPTSNKMYASVRGRFIKSKLNRLYDLQVTEWAINNLREIIEIKSSFKDKLLEVSCTFVFNKSRVFTVKGELKKMDHTNRIKATHDGLSKALEIDDSRFVSTPCFKMWCNNEEDEQVMIEIKESELKEWKK